MDDPLARFSDRTREWFARAFAGPTDAQRLAWPAIASGGHVLLSAPTGSGKTLAAFLWAIDALSRDATSPAPGQGASSAAGERPGGIALVYVSPLKALSYDIDRNLRVPLAGIGASLTVAVRTGDTPARERQRMLRDPPDILITTPESLYLMLTGAAQNLFADTRWCIVDEVHAIAATKRGAHLALTLERLSARSAREVQRIGLSATQNPLEEVGRFLVGPNRQCTIVDAGRRKPLDLKIHVPVESMSAPGDTPGQAELDPLLGGGEPTRNSIWPAMYPELLSLVRAHRSTIIFVNSRRGAERLALRLNELAAAETETGTGSEVRVEAEITSTDPPPVVEIARAHHGSLAREERTVVEELLKSGALPCLVATSSLELGIDMGAVDLVIQVESPKSVASGLQRIGRAGHNVGDVSRGRIFPKFRADLLECAVVARRMREGEIETTVVPKNPLDVLAQQIVAIAAAAGEAEPVPVGDLFALVTASYSFAELTEPVFESVLDMLDGRYPSTAFAELRPRIIWDRLTGTIRPRRGAQQLAVTNAGTIPDRGLFAVTLPDGRRVGELDEEMVYEARPGQTFLLGASTWRIEEIGRDRVIVTPAPGLPGAVPFWKGDSVGRPAELGAAIGAFSRWAVDADPSDLAAGYDLDDRAAVNLVTFLREQREATRVIPSDETIVIERFRDEIGDWRVCVLSPYGGRVHAAWALAISALLRDELGLESDAIWSDDGIIIHLPDAEELDSGRIAELVVIDPDELDELIVGELGASALFGARFRENAGRALLIPRARPGKRTPLWQQRLKSQSLLEVARRYEDFPIVLETYRECLQDVFDLPALKSVLGKLGRREISLVEIETTSASPFASSLLFDYVATYMYEGDTPNAERRAAALSLDRDLLRELLGQEELRDLLDPDALTRVEADLQFLSEPRRVTGTDACHDMLRSLGDLSAGEVAARCAPDVDAAALLASLEAQRRAVRVRVGGEPRWIAAADAGLYRDALGVVPPGGLPDAFLTAVPDAMLALTRRFGATHGPFPTAWLSERYGVDATPALTLLERDGELVRGELRPGGSGREWCHPEVLRRIRRASLAALRKEVEPVDALSLARFLPAWQGIDRHAPAGAGIDRLRDVLVSLQGIAALPEVWERDLLPRRVGAYSPAWLDQLCAAGEIVWFGAGSLGTSGRVALYFREDLALFGELLMPRRPEFTGDLHRWLRERLARGACFYTDLLVGSDARASDLQAALWDLVWAGEVTNDAFVPLRAGRRSPGAGAATARAGLSRRPGTFASRRRAATAVEVQGRWSLTETLLPATADPSARRRAVAELLLERYGVLTREHVLAEGLAGGFSAIYPELTTLETLGTVRRGYFIEGLGGAQFALPGAVERLRQRPPLNPTAVVLAAVDPAQPYGTLLPWPNPPGNGCAGRPRAPARVAGAYVVLCGGEPILYLERGAKGLLSFVPDADARLNPALAALAAHVRDGRGLVRRIGLERVNGEPALASTFDGALLEVGFQEGPRRLTLSA
ncbi:DEAD/DEAH box helicase [Conexibacter sp. DBS9H8]|uniref:Lhr family helicase n=1 Tax=Conexibacter sp. DBS9H8 TaxID=2937801 RepID=UPI00200E8D7F|nr:DEAD/DEAH box helicase [Conexibacter sp. DBS9H8]